MEVYPRVHGGNSEALRHFFQCRLKRQDDEFLFLAEACATLRFCPTYGIF